MEKIIDVNSSKQFQEDYTRYGVYVMYARVIPDYRDGLKPIHRRILWSAYHDSKAITNTVKSASIVGNVISEWSPHGDCLDGNTMLYTLDNKFITIEQAYASGIQALHVLSVDPYTKKIVPAVATNFRIGQYTNKEYRIHLSNGAIVSCTSNHPFMLKNGEWVKAENLYPGARLYSDKISAEVKDGVSRPYIQNELLHIKVYNYYYGIPPAGFERHHKDFNVWNNTPENLVALTKLDHLNEHKGSDKAIYGLNLGRKSMFDQDGKYRDKIKAKNSFMMSQYNKDQAFRRFKLAVKTIQEYGYQVTEENYEKFRGIIHNLPIVANIIKNHPEYGCNNFYDLINYELPSISDLFSENIEKIYSDIKDSDKNNMNLYNPIEFYYDKRFSIYKVFDRMLESGVPLTVDNYYKTRNHNQTKTTVVPDKVSCLIDFYRKEFPYVDFVEVVDVLNKPMYDFTVNGNENMMIPVRTTNNMELDNCIGYNLPMICVHNSATYGAIKPMVNWFESKVPLMDKQGNFGTFQGDEASAYRYTECKLSKFAYDCLLKDLADSKECVDWTPNFKNTQLEPQYLPCAVPLLLINGTFAIGVGKKPEIPTHNLNEVIDAAINLMYNPNYEPILIPDHCMNCEIIDTDWRSISRLGFGYYTVRGIIDVENYTKHHYKNRTALVIKSVPNLTFLNSITDKIEEMINNKKIIQIEDMFDESEKDDMRYVIILKPGADVEYVKNMIYKNTLLEQTPRINFEAIDGLNPKRMSYKAYLLSFIDHRKLTKFRVYTNKLQDVQTKIHEKEAFIKVFESGYIDEIIKMLRNRKTVADDEALTEFLIKKIKITKLQAQYIINVRLKQLQEGNLKNLKEERSQLEKLKDEYLSIILSEEKLTNIIINELQQIKATYGKPRTCRVIKDNNSSDVPKGAMTVTITEKNFIKKVPYGSPISNPKSDSIRICINVDNSENILIFDNMGKVFKLAVNKIPFADKNSGGTDIRFLIKGLTADICDIIPDTLFTSGNKSVKHYLLTLSKMGYIKKMDLEDFVNIPSSGLIYAKLEDGDYIRSIAVPIENMNVLVFSEKKAMNIPVSNVSLMKRNARGNRTFKSSFVDGMTLLPPKDSLQYNKVSLMVITEFGRFNKLPIAGVPNLDTVKKQFNVIKATKGDRILDIHVVDENSTIVVKTLMDMHSIPVSAIPASSSISNGEKILNTTKDKIIRTYVK